MTQRRNLKRNLNLIKKSIEEQPRYKIELNDLPKRMNNNVSDVDSGDQIDFNRQEINFSTVKDLDNTQNNTIKDTQNSTIKDTQNSTMWSSDEELYNTLHDDNDFCQSIPNSKSSPVLFKSKWNRKKYNVDFKKIKKGTEIGDFIDAHPDFTISNLINTFEEIEILEYGLSTPRFDFRFDFEQSSIKTGIDLEIIPKGVNKREVVRT